MTPSIVRMRSIECNETVHNSNFRQSGECILPIEFTRISNPGNVLCLPRIDECIIHRLRIGHTYVSYAWIPTQGGGPTRVHWLPTAPDSGTHKFDLSWFQP